MSSQNPTPGGANGDVFSTSLIDPVPESFTGLPAPSTSGPSSTASSRQTNTSVPSPTPFPPHPPPRNATDPIVNNATFNSTLNGTFTASWDLPPAASGASGSGPASAAHGQIAAAAVGGSVGALLAVALALLFLWLQRRRRARGPHAGWTMFSSAPGAAAELQPAAEQRLAALEGEVAALRAEMRRLRRASSALVARGPSLVYTRDKGAEAAGDRREDKDGPPTYMD